jgi:putative restriction endonuclease
MSAGNPTDLEAAIAKVSGEHADALHWFSDHTGQTVGWDEIKDHADQGARLVTQAKGIYKPHYTNFALSVRQTLDSPYADKEIERRADGSWVYPYFQENPDPSQRDREATNPGL